MTLFKKTDWDLPYLTRFYQVAPPMEEVKEIMASPNTDPPFEEGDEPEALLLTEMHEFLKDDWIATQPDNLKSIRFFCNADAISRYADLQVLVRQAMDALADRDSISVSVLKKIQVLIKERQESYHLVTSGGDPFEASVVERMEDEERVTAREIVLVPTRYNPEDTYERIVGELTDLFRTRRPVDRCDVCGSAFPVARTGQQYCSNRCSGLVRVRRSRQRAEEGKQEEVVSL